ncbi:hypothetical protein DL98DRAFT_575025 [Cadophora sp. DSE1049]|nr:hypothetical protein DL98DRAFT_575025 [Cadophora sp. DSE1049]
MNHYFIQVLDPMKDIGKNPVQPLQKYFADLERSKERLRRCRELKLHTTELQWKTKRIDLHEGSIFHKFPELPKEIRLLIWEAVCDEPQIIPVQSKSVSSYVPCAQRAGPRRKKGPPYRLWGWSKSFLVACSLHSSIITVNKEARKIAQKSYTLVDTVAPGYYPVLANLNKDLLRPVDWRTQRSIEDKQRKGEIRANAMVYQLI